MIPEFITPSSAPKRNVSESSSANDSANPEHLLDNGAFQKALHKQADNRTTKTSTDSGEDQAGIPPVVRDENVIAASESDTRTVTGHDAQNSVQQNAASSRQIRRIDSGEPTAEGTNFQPIVADLKDSTTRTDSLSESAVPGFVSTEPSNPGTLPSLNRQSLEPAPASQSSNHVGEPAEAAQSRIVQEPSAIPNNGLVSADVLLLNDDDTPVPGSGITSTEPSLIYVSPIDAESVDLDAQFENDDLLSFPTLPSLRPDFTLTAEIAVPLASAIDIEPIPAINDVLPQSSPAVTQPPEDVALPATVQPVDIQSAPAIFVDTTEPLDIEALSPEALSPETLAQDVDVVQPNLSPPVLPSLSRGVNRKPETSTTQQAQVPTPIQSVPDNSTTTPQPPVSQQVAAGTEAVKDTAGSVVNTTQSTAERVSSTTGFEPARDADGVAESEQTSAGQAPSVVESGIGESAVQDSTNKPAKVESQPNNSPVVSPSSVTSVNPDNTSRDDLTVNSNPSDATVTPDAEIRETEVTTESPSAVADTDAVPVVSSSPVIDTKSSLSGESLPVPTHVRTNVPVSHQTATAIVAEPAVEVVENKLERNVATAGSEARTDSDSGVPIASQATPPVSETEPVSKIRNTEAEVVIENSERGERSAINEATNRTANESPAPGQASQALSEASSQPESRINDSPTIRASQTVTSETQEKRQDAGPSGLAEVDKQTTSSSPQPSPPQIPAADQVAPARDDSLAIPVVSAADGGSVESPSIPVESEPTVVVGPVSTSSPTKVIPPPVVSNVPKTDTAQATAIPMDVQDAVSAIQDATSGDDHIRVRLNPRELGSMFVDVARTDAGIVARLEVETSAARVAVLETLPDLQQSLSRSGAVVDRIDVVLSESRAESGRQDGDQQQQKEQQQSRQNRQSSDQRQARDEQNQRRERQNNRDTPPDESSDIKRPDELDIKL